MRGSSPLLIIVILLPLAAALGHDLYLYYQNYEDKGFELSTLGYIWTHYHVDSYKWMVEQTAPEKWKYIDSVLKYEATLVATTFAVMVFLLMFLLRILGITGKQDSGGGSRVDRLTGGGKKKQFKYKRK